MNKIVELLAPAGDIEKAYTALNFGADAVYVGGKSYSLRARAGNFELNELKEICEFAHSKNKKIHIVLNVICHNALIDGFEEYLEKIMSLKPDALIVADPFIIYKIFTLYPSANLHISTQQSICNSKSCLFFKNNGASRIITARELSYENLKNLKDCIKNNIELECFIHGAVCIAYSGRCMLSNNFSLRDANVGGCAQSCRWEWTLYDRNKIYTHKFSMSAKDMCQLSNISKLLDLKIDSFKIEGRMKSVHYIATVVNSYRKIIDSYYNNSLSSKYLNEYLDEINKAANRLTSIAWFNGHPTTNEMLYHEQERELKQTFAFVILKKSGKSHYEVIAKNHFSINQEFEVIGTGHELIKIKLLGIYDQDNIKVESARTPMRKYTIVIDNDNLAINDIARINC